MADRTSVRTEGNDTVDYLLNLDRGQIQAALGEPHVCGTADVRGVDGRNRPVTPCEAENDWYYSMARGSPGTGPELLLHFNERNVCVRAGWREAR